MTTAFFLVRHFNNAQPRFNGQVLSRIVAVGQNRQSVEGERAQARTDGYQQVIIPGRHRDSLTATIELEAVSSEGDPLDVGLDDIHVAMLPFSTAQIFADATMPRYSLTETKSDREPLSRR